MTQSTPSLQSNGSAWAALLAAGIGGFIFGVLTDISEASKVAADKFQWYRPAGSLSGVAIASVALWVILWFALHLLWKNKQFQNQAPLLITLCVLILAAILTTFPPFYELLGG